MTDPAYSVICPACRADVGAFCRDADDLLYTPHAARVALAAGEVAFREAKARVAARRAAGEPIWDLLVDDAEPSEVEELESLVEPEGTPSVSATAMIAYGKGKYTWVLLGVRGAGWYTTGQTAWSGGGTGKPLDWSTVEELIEDADWVVEVVRDAPITDIAEWHEELGEGFD